ncbi:MAG TPA: VOC family protein [Dehalococcoidia bacterium]|nr:VOC family protein [Dehalococcoidia bacterium]
MVEDWARPVVAVEIQAREPEKQREFYSKMFNWDISDGPIMRFGAGIGGPEPGPVGVMRESSTARVVLYIQVMDLRASLQKAENLGGKIISQPFDVPNGPTIAQIADPEGNTVGLVQQ